MPFWGPRAVNDHLDRGQPWTGPQPALHVNPLLRWALSDCGEQLPAFRQTLERVVSEILEVQA